MTVFELVIVPGVLLAAFLAGLLVIAAMCACRWLGYVAARRRAAEITPARYEALHHVTRRQADVIAAVIGELESRRATYETFPEVLRGELFAAHESATEIERNYR